MPGPASEIGVGKHIKKVKGPGPATQKEGGAPDPKMGKMLKKADAGITASNSVREYTEDAIEGKKSLKPTSGVGPMRGRIERDVRV